MSTTIVTTKGQIVIPSNLRKRCCRKADEIAEIIKTLPVEIVDVDIRLAHEAATLKAVYRLSYADCFAAGLAKMIEASLITGDMELKSLEKEIEIIWI
jgi:predicted nucleic acid-binding protein